MARRKSSNSNNGGCLGAFLLIGLAVYLFENYWPVILIVGLVVLIIWSISRSVQENRANSNTASNTATPISQMRFDSLDRYNNTTGSGSTSVAEEKPSRRATPKMSDYVSNDPTISQEVHRQIRETLSRREEISSRIDRTQKDIWKINRSFGKGNEEKAIKRDALIEQKSVLEGRLNATVYTFKESNTPRYTELKSALVALGRASTKTYDSTPASGQIVVPYNPIGDMNLIRFSVEPVCLSLGGDVFCIIPSYIVRFKKNGSYLATYTCKTLIAGLINGSYDERVENHTWRHTCKDGSPDLRYRDNPMITYYTTRTHTVPNMLSLELAEHHLKYEVDSYVRNKVVASVKDYNSIEPTKTYDTVYHTIRLLDACDPDNPNLRKLNNILSGDDNYIEYEDNEPASNTSPLYQNNRHDWRPVEEPHKPSKAKRFLKGFLKLAVAGTAIIAGVTYGPTVVEHFQNVNTTPAPTIFLPTATPKIQPRVTATTAPTAPPASTPTPTPSTTGQTQSFIAFDDVDSDNGETSESGVEYSVLQSGGKGAEVERLKQRLIELGYMTGSWKGYYDPATIEAVKQFQQDAGLSVTGIADAETQTALYSTTLEAQAESVPENVDVDSSETAVADNTPEPTAEPTAEPTPRPILTPSPEPAPEAISISDLSGMHGFEYAQGSRGDATRYIQQMLIDQGYLAAGQADGVCGPKTETAVKAFQEANGLAVTGIVDLPTQFKLAELESGFAQVEGQRYEYAGLNRYGVYRFDGGVYIGLVKADQSYQEGTLYYEDGTTYAGAFKDNQRSGKGEAWYPNGDYYNGNWKNDKMNGKGVYHFGKVDSVEQYDGEWIDGMMSGKGIYTMADGTTIKGIWENNQQIGWWK